MEIDTIKEKLGYNPTEPIYRPEKKFQIIGSDPKFLEALEDAITAAPTPTNVLIQGETGTGKELFARTIHFLSEYPDGKFIPINCAGIPIELLESELFGSVKGAYTGAYTDRKGYIESANEGTLFLDEIGDMPINLQSKLLRTLDERKITRLGDTKEIPVNFRLICATNKNLEENVRKKEFRSDLYYRLNTIPIYIPPLRERIEDISLLVYYFIDKFSKNFNKQIKISPDEMKLLLVYNWPGNVREVKNFIESSFVIGKIKIGEIEKKVLDEIQPLRQAKENFEKEYFLKLLTFTRGNQVHAARIAGMARQNLHKKLGKYGIKPKDFKK